MRPLKVAFRPEAANDLAAIFGYVLEISRNRTIATGFVLRLWERCERIGNAPHAGRPRDDLAPGLRTFPFEKSAVIAYKIDGDLVQITNIFCPEDAPV